MLFNYDFLFFSFFFSLVYPAVYKFMVEGRFNNDAFFSFFFLFFLGSVSWNTEQELLFCVLLGRIVCRIMGVEQNQ